MHSGVRLRLTNPPNSPPDWGTARSALYNDMHVFTKVGAYQQGSDFHQGRLCRSFLLLHWLSHTVAGAAGRDTDWQWQVVV